MTSVATSKKPTVLVTVFSIVIKQVLLWHPASKQSKHPKMGMEVEQAAEPQRAGRYVEEL
jgi:hypothetical protein